MMAALDIMPWAAPAILTILVGAGVLLRRGRHPRAANIVLAIAAVAAVAWLVSSVVMALRAIA
jgi:hypothetical protein